GVIRGPVRVRSTNPDDRNGSHRVPALAGTKSGSGNQRTISDVVPAAANRKPATLLVAFAPAQEAVPRPASLRAALSLLGSGVGQAPGAVDAGIALEVRRDGRGADLLALGELGHRLGIQAETAEVVGEVQHPALCQPRHRSAQQPHVLALD